MATDMRLESPLLLVLGSDNAAHAALHWDGSFSVTCILPQSVKLAGRHGAKLLYLFGDSDKELAVSASFVRAQCYGRKPARVLGTSVAQSNVYVPVDGAALPSVVVFTFRCLDGTPLRPQPRLYFAVHLAPLPPIPTLS